MKNDGKAGDENADGLDARDDAALWDLLGRAPRPEPGPYFVRRVLREVGQHEQARAAASARWWQPAALWRAVCRVPRVAFLTGAPVAALGLLFLGLHANPLGRTGVPSYPSMAAMPSPAGGAESPAEDADPDGATLHGTSLANNALPDDVSAQDVEVIADLDNLLKREESRLWTEDDTARF